MGTTKRMVAGIVAGVMVVATSISASAEVNLALYKNSHGGPSHMTEEFSIYKNTGDTYYASCTHISAGTLTIEGTNNTPNKRLVFSSAKRIDFKSTTYDDSLYFVADYSVGNSIEYATVNVTVGS